MSFKWPCYCPAPAPALFLLCSCPAPALFQFQLLPCSYHTPALVPPSSYPDLSRSFLIPSQLLPYFCSALLSFTPTLFLPCSFPAPALLLLPPCSCLAPACFCPAPAYFHLAAFIIISTLQLFSAQREQPVMVCFTVKYHKINHFLQFFIRTLPSLIFNLFTEKTTTGRDCMSDFN